VGGAGGVGQVGVTGEVHGFDRVTVKGASVVPLFPSVTVASLIDIRGGSLSRMVAWPCESATLALEAPDRLTKKTSSFSTAVSSITETETALPVSPGAKVSVPLVAV